MRGGQCVQISWTRGHISLSHLGDKVIRVHDRDFVPGHAWTHFFIMDTDSKYRPPAGSKSNECGKILHFCHLYHASRALDITALSDPSQQALAPPDIRLSAGPC